jgi:carbon monoxide dehydrogenase subunit G
MEMSSSQLVPASQQKTWEALNDPEILKACITGCESIVKVTDNEYQIAMAVKVGPVSAKFKGKMLLADLNPPTSYAISFEGQGGAAGFAKGSAKVSLAPEGSATRLSYTVGAQVGGKLAQIGSRLIDGAAKKMADDFFAAFVTLLGGPPGVPLPGLAAKPAPVAGTKLWLWVAAAIAAAIVIYFLVK